MAQENLIREFVNMWHRLKAENLDVQILFEDGESHRISDPVEIILNTDTESICWN